MLSYGIQSATQRLGISNYKKQNLDAAIELLTKHATKIDPQRALLLLPNLPAARIREYLESMNKHLLQKKHEGQIFRNLLLSQHLQVQDQRIKLQEANKVIIDDHSLCAVCHKRIGKR